MYKKYNEISEQDKKLLNKIGEKDFTDYNEQSIREEVIAPILRMLGYEKNSDYEVEREESYNANELFIKIGSHKRQKLDYICNVRKNNFWLIEAKNGNEHDITQEQLEQAYFYSIHPKVNCRFFAVTNGWIFNLYDRDKFLSDGSSDILTPVLSIKHSELADKFHILYSYLGASNIIFNIKSECLLKEIEKTLSAEVYLKRLEYFENAVKNVIKKSEREVYRNIAKLEKESDKKYETYLKSLKPFEILTAVFGHRTINKDLSMACKILKENILDLAKHAEEDWTPIDHTIVELLPTENFRQITIVDPAYLYNIIRLLLEFKFDEDYKNLWCHYNNKKVFLPNLLEEYLYEFYSFFPNKPHVRLLLRLFSLIYRHSKMIVYGFEPIKTLATMKQRYNEYCITEEELGNAFYSKGHELIKLAENITFQHLNMVYKQIYNEQQEINNNKAQSIIRQLEIDIEALSEKVNYEEMMKNLPKDEQDGMMAIDSEYENPWRLMFFAISNILPTNYKHSQRCLDRIKQYNELGFNFENKQLTEERLQKQEKILETLKYNFSKLENIL